MNMLKKGLVAAAAAVGCAGGAMAATTWSYNWAAADAALGVANARPLSNATNELKFTAESVVRFNDLDNSGGISAGDTFIDYIVVRVDQLFIGGGNNGETGFGYGTSREITLTAVLTGTQVLANTYTVNPGGVLNWFYDSGAGFTSASFGALATFIDGNGAPGAAVNVEDGTVVAPSGGLNSDLVPDGTINVRMLMQDLLAGADFEVSPTGGVLAMQLGISDGNNNVCADSGGTASCFSTTGSILSFFGAGALGPNQFQFHTRTDGSFVKIEAVPEPGSLALAALALVAVGAVAQRHRRKS